MNSLSCWASRLMKLLPTTKTLSKNIETSSKIISSTVGKEFTNDAKEAIAIGAVKFDAGKSPVYRGAVSYFPLAIAAVATVSSFGASKYAWNGWRSVPDGINRYSDALVRHILDQSTGEAVAPDSGLLHAAHVAWNSLAVLELLLSKEREATTANSAGTTEGLI